MAVISKLIHRMKSKKTTLGRLASCGVALAILGLAFSPRSLQAQTATTIVYPAWMVDCGITGAFAGPISNRYLMLWEYHRGAELTRFNVWTSLGDPLNPLDDFFFIGYFDQQGTTYTLECDWGSRLISSQRPTRCVVGANGRTSGDDRPVAGEWTLHVEDSAAADGFTDYRFPEGGSAELAPAVATLPHAQGYYAPFTVPTNAPTASGIDLQVTQKTQFARDLIRIELMVKNRSGSARRVGARFLLDPYVDLRNGGFTNSVFLPKTRERVLFEKEYRNASVPDEWEMYDDDEGPAPNYIAKGIMRGNGATAPSRVIFGNTLDMFPFVVANTTYDWVTRSDFELRISDIGMLMYWDPVIIPAGRSKSFVTYAGMGVANHGMSDFYQATAAGQLPSQGFVAAVQSPFALPLVNGDADTSTATLTAYFQNELQIATPSSFAFLELPDGLKFADSDSGQSPRLELGAVAAVGDSLDERSGNWVVQPTGIEAGLLPVTVTFGNAYGDSSRAVRYVNVPQGRLYQLSDDWRFVTFPFTYTDLQDDPAQVLGLPPGTFQIVRYNSEINDYEQVSRILPGHGYWIRMLGQGTTFVRLNDANPINLATRDIFTSTIRQGWNQVGNPSPYVVPVRELQFVTAFGGILSFEDAVSSGFIRAGLYAYNRKTNQYEALNRESLVQPGRAIWIYANGERTILWPAPQGPARSITP